MEPILQASLKSWRERLKEEVIEITEQLKSVKLGSDEDFLLSSKLGRKNETLAGIETELDRSIKRETDKREIKFEID